MAARKRSIAPIYELTIELQYIEPRIWRRFLVPATLKLPQLHDLLQLAMGWTNSHLYRFAIGNRRIAMVGIDEFADPAVPDESKQTLAAALGDTVREFTYEYDFADGWSCRIGVQPVAQRNPDWSYPLCTGGARAAPPDDVGGPPGYEGFLAAITDPAHEDHDHQLAWIGGAFDPAGFDLNAINHTLRLGRR
jgi:hypothetical protein